jgi:hypothetical protein
VLFAPVNVHLNAYGAIALMANKYRLTREEQMLTPEQKEKLRYLKNEKKKEKPATRAEMKEAEELGVSVESLRAMKAEAANESSAAEFAEGATFKKYKNGGMVTKANCGASMKPTQKSTGAVKMACGGMAYKGKK